ncbi:MAG TPA: SDR family oxidoreductase [Actinomycetes bacterium]|jgi:3-oxoacyl-[acyl-carrier protein] reductase|nr:SDR family oxidoreductase [Actinomycetes bacterium]
MDDETMHTAPRVALVTGAGGGGTGRAIAVRLAKDSAVVVNDVDVGGGRHTVELIEHAGGRAAFHSADVTSEADVRSLLEFTVDTFGGLDILVNNAGGTPDPHFPQAPVEHWSRYLDLNLRAPMLCIHYALPIMRERGGGAVVNVSSVAGLGYAAHDSPEYAAAKAGLIRLTATLDSLYEQDRVRVNCVVPNWIGTPEVLEEIAAMSPEERARVPDRLTPPEEIAEAVVGFIQDDQAAGRVLVCWSAEPWRLVPVTVRGDR